MHIRSMCIDVMETDKIKKKIFIKIQRKIYWIFYKILIEKKKYKNFFVSISKQINCLQWSGNMADLWTLTSEDLWIEDLAQ